MLLSCFFTYLIVILALYNDTDIFFCQKKKLGASSFE